MPLEKEKEWGHRMNKQQLAQKIWASANQMRSKIEANEYKDYILGFIFYKYLSDKEVKFLKENDYDNELLKTVSEEDAETVEFTSGYFSDCPTDTPFLYILLGTA